MEKASVKEGELDALQVSHLDLALTVIPELGAKVSSIRWNEREVLARNPRRPFRLAKYGAAYSDYDASGLDECFPSIGACVYLEPPFSGLTVPDHGELWSIPWKVAFGRQALHMQTDGVEFPYRFIRRLEIIAPGWVRFSYTLRNLADTNWRAFWSAHPLLAIKPGMRIHLPENVRVRLDWSKDGRLGRCLQEHSWPWTTDKSGQPVDLSLVQPPEVQFVEKLYTTQLEEGWCTLYDPNDGYYVAAIFSPVQIPYIGLSINLGGWPLGENGYYNLGLEPCTGYPDRLDMAIRQGDCWNLSSEEELSWEWHLFIGVTDNWLEEVRFLQNRVFHEFGLQTRLAS